MFECEQCGEKFDNVKIKANHVRWKHQTDLFHQQTKEKLKDCALASNAKRFGEYVNEVTECTKCNIEISITYREGKRKKNNYCGLSCANSREGRIHSDEAKQKMSITAKKMWADGFYEHTSAKNFLNLPNQFSSKKEREIVKFFKDTYPDDGWTFGGGLKFNDIRLSRDLYSNKLKVCIEYDGEWHWKDIHGQLEDKQLKDRTLEEWCIENGYRLIRIDEKAFKSMEQLVQAVYHSTDQIIKIGDRYEK